MLTINLEQKSFDLRTKFNEITIKEYNKIINTMNKETDLFFESWLEILEILGMSKEFINNLDIENLVSIIEEFNLTNIENNELEILKEIEIYNYTYRLFEGDKFKITVRISQLIEKTIKSHPDNFISYTMANLYKRTDLTDIEHTDKAHIEHKVKLFEQLTVDKCLVLFIELFESLVKKIQKFNND